MTISTPLRSATSPQQGASLWQRLGLLARRRWQYLRSVLLRGTPIVLDPFGFLPGQTSALVDGAGDDAPLVPGYAFHTHYTPCSARSVRFQVRLPGLTAKSGQLMLAIVALNDTGASVDPKVKHIALSKLMARGGKAAISMPADEGYSYALIGVLTGNADARADSIAISMRGGERSDALHARFAAARRDFLSTPGTGLLAPLIVDRPPTLAEPISQMCTAAQMSEPRYGEWCGRLGIPPFSHRKQWEFVFISRALEYHGALRNGARGLGFGVGLEPLPSLYAALGCHIVATDLPSGDTRAQMWSDTDQLGVDLGHIHNPRLCDDKTFFDRVSYRAVDMNAIPSDLTDFDFTWSSCAYEHLGSIEAGLRFFENSLECLKPGGLAVHTTEINLSSNGSTLENGSTVIFRRRDFEDLAERLLAKGHEVMPITFDSGNSELDRVIDLPPYSNDPHLKLQLLRWVSTSFGMIVRKNPSPAR